MSDASKYTTRGRLFIFFRFFAEFTAKASSLITFPLLSRYLGPEGYGVNTQTTLFVSFLVPVATLGLGYGVVRMVAGKQSREYISARFFSTLLLVLASSSLLCVLIVLLAPILNTLFIKVDWATPIIRWAAPLIILNAVENTLRDYYRARLRIIAYSVMQVIQTVAYVAAVALVLTSGGGLLQLVWAWLGIKALYDLGALLYFLAIGEIHFQKELMPRSEIAELLRFGFPIVVTGLSAWVIAVGDRGVIGYFLNASQVGVYNAGYTLAGIIGALASPFWNPLYPLMATYKNNQDRAGLGRVCRKYTNAFSLIGIPGLVGLIVLSQPLLVQFGTADFALSYPTFTFIALGLFCDQFAANAQYLVYLHNEPVFLRNVTILSGLTNIALNLVLVPTLGITGAALSTLFSYVLLDGLLYRQVIRYGYHIGELYDFHTIGRFCVGALVMGVVIYWINLHIQYNVTVLFAVAGAGVAAYCLALLALYRFNPKNLLEKI